MWAAALLLMFVVSRVAGPIYSSGNLMKGYLIGLIGLIGIGLALLLTWQWFSASGPQTPRVRTALRVVLALGTALWVVLMIFPFL